MPKKKLEKHTHDVDLAVRSAIYEAAKLRLEGVTIEERQKYGIRVTTLTDIGRQAILTWRPDARRKYPEVKPRSPNGQAPDRTPFRFELPKEQYLKAKALIQQYNLSVTGVVEESLQTFAETGRLPRTP